MNGSLYNPPPTPAHAHPSLPGPETADLLRMGETGEQEVGKRVVGMSENKQKIIIRSER